MRKNTINVGPDYQGHIRAIDAKTLKKVGKYIKTNYKLPDNWNDDAINQYKIH